TPATIPGPATGETPLARMAPGSFRTPTTWPLLAIQPACRPPVAHCFAGTRPGMDDGLRDHTCQNKASGNDLFRRQIEALVGRSLELRPRGRSRPAPEK